MLAGLREYECLGCELHKSTTSEKKTPYTLWISLDSVGILNKFYDVNFPKDESKGNATFSVSQRRR